MSLCRPGDTAYYNEFEPYAAQFLRNLIRGGHIAPGYVDERSILDVKPSDLAGFKQHHFFAGVGIWSLALRRAGWADDRPVWTGSCPCQPFSDAGKGIGFADERHLWPAWLQLIAQYCPTDVFGEQVASKDGLAWLDLVHADLEGAGYAFGAADSCSAGVGAPHIRQRLYFVGVADTDSGEPEQFAGPGPRPDETQGRRPPGEPIGCGHAVGLGNNNNTGLERLGCGHQAESGRDRTIRPIAAPGEFSGLAHAEYPGVCGESGGLDCTQTSARDRQHLHDSVASDDDGWLADGHGVGLDTGAVAGIRPHAKYHAEPCGGNVGVADANGGTCGQGGTVDLGRHQGSDAHLGAGLGGGGVLDALDDRGRPGPTNGLWREVDWLFCRDGKWRPVEPGTFPLAHGAASRVGRLRAYGNGLNVDQAKIFIESVM